RILPAVLAAAVLLGLAATAPARTARPRSNNSALSTAGPAAPAPRPPAVPLVTHDPYFSVWSPADRLTDTATVHWTGRPHNLRSMVRVDGRSYRLMGAEPKEAAPLPQTGLTVLPTRTTYSFAGSE